MPETNPTPDPEKKPQSSLRRKRINALVEARSLKGAAKTSASPILILLIPIVFLLGIGAGYLIWGNRTAGDVNSGYVFNPAGDSPSIGPADAPITIVEFGDYQCPYCTQWHNEVYKQLLAEYPGKIRFVYRNFPLYSIHPGAEPAAEAAACAGDQNAFWQYHDLLFTDQYALTSQGFQQYASDLGLDTNAFANCLTSHRFQNAVMKDYKEAANIGVQSTPTFFINGFQLVGAQPYEAFKSVIDQILSTGNTK